MAQFTEAEARALLEKVQKLSRADAIELSLTGTESGNIRWARNTVSTAGRTDNLALGIRSHFGRKVGATTCNEFDDAALERAVRRAEELARLAPEDPEYMAPLGAQPYRPVHSFHESTAGLSAEQRAQVCGESIAAAKAKQGVAAGFLSHNATWVALANSNGLWGYHRQTGVNLTVTVRTEDGLGSGFGTRDANDFARLDAAAASRIAAEKAIASRDARAIEPGKYTVILEPAASVDLLQQMVLQMDARNADEGRSYLSKKGGGTKLGEQLVDERVTIISDPRHPGAETGPWSADGRPQERRVWIENGVVKQLAYSRYWAEKQGVPPVPGPANLVMSGGTASLEELIRGTERGVLVTRTWYIRPVDPQTLLYTGLTRDGTFYIEGGKIKHAVKNFRFNESPVIMLNNLDALGVPVRVRNAETALTSVIPPMRVRDFTFTSLSDAV